MRLVLAIVGSCARHRADGCLGIAQRTIWAGPASIDAIGQTTGDAPVTVIDGAVFNAFAGNPTLIAQSDGAIFAAYGRTTDVLAWVGDASYNLVGIDSETGELTTKVVRGDESEVPDPDRLRSLARGVRGRALAARRRRHPGGRVGDPRLRRDRAAAVPTSRSPGRSTTRPRSRPRS